MLPYLWDKVKGALDGALEAVKVEGEREEGFLASLGMTATVSRV